MITSKIKNKLKEKCQKDTKAYEVIMDLLNYEDEGRGKQNIHCKDVVENYAKEYSEYENSRS